MSSLKEYLGESILDAIHEKLSSDLWIGEKVKPTAKVHILKKAETWLKNYTDKPIEQAYLLGSMTGFQYNKDSDVDINIIVKITNEELKKLTKLLPNGQILPGGGAHPVNYFISNKRKKEWEKAGSIYDLLKNKWIRKSKKEESSSVISNYKAVVEIARFFITGLNAVVSEYERDVADYETYKSYLENTKERDEIKRLMDFKLQEILADIDSISIADKLIHSFRKEAFAESGAFDTRIDIIGKTANESVNNLIYKYLERLSYFSKIRNIKDKSAKWEKLVEE